MKCVGRQTHANPGAAGLSAPCEVLQVRHIDRQGDQSTRGYNLAAFKTDPMFGADLNPLISSTETGVAPDPPTVVTCGDNDIDDRLTTHITVTRTADGWTVSHVKAPGC